MLIDFGDVKVFFVFLLLTIITAIMGARSKKSIYAFITLIVYLATLMLHVVFSERLGNPLLNIIVDFTGIAISIALYIIIDEIESRREKISAVFENKYKKLKEKEKELQK